MTHSLHHMLTIEKSHVSTTFEKSEKAVGICECCCQILLKAQ